MNYRNFFLLNVLFFLMILPLPTQGAQRGVSVASNLDTWGRYHALIIGINQYAEWPVLRTAVKDATVLKELLVSRYGFKSQDVILRTDKSATRKQIIRDLRYLATSMDKTDNLLIYYAGHGQLDDLTGDGYWVPVEGGLKAPDSWVSNSLIKNVLSSNRVLAKNIVVIADSCYSGSMLRGGPSLVSLEDRRYLDKLRKQARKRSRQVISSGGVEPVADGGAEGHSLFAFYLIDALRNNDREVIDLENLFHTKVWRPVTEIGNQRPNVGRLKTPMDQDGQFVLYNTVLERKKAAARQVAASVPQKAGAGSLSRKAAPRNLNAEEEMWAIVKTSSSIEDYTFFLGEFPDGRFSGAAKLKIKLLKRKQKAAIATAAVAPAAVKAKAARSAAELPDVKADPAIVGGKYTKKTSGIVYDRSTGLEWYAGPDRDMNWYEARDWVKNLAVGGGGWRLPRQNDLRSLHDKNKGKQAVTSLPAASRWHVWSVLTGESTASWACSFNFRGNGTWIDNNYVSASSNMRVIAVRVHKETAPESAEAKKQPRLYASAGPAAGDHVRRNSRKTAENSYKLALFPIKVQIDWGAGDNYKDEAIRKIVSIGEEEDRIEFAFSYRQVAGLPDHVRFFSDIADKAENAIWSKPSMFSRYEPDWEQLVKVGTQIDADLGVLFSLQTGSHSALDVYLYDFRRKKAYSRKNIISSGGSTDAVLDNVRQYVHTEIKKYLRNN